MIGDQVLQDGLFAQRLKSKFLLISDKDSLLNSSGHIPIGHQFGNLKDAVDYLLSHSSSNDFSGL